MAGSWSNSYQTSLTIPTGATSGARIVIDGESDRILFYDENDNIIMQLGGAQAIMTSINVTEIHKDLIIQDGALNLGWTDESNDWATIFAEAGEGLLAALQIASVTDSTSAYTDQSKLRLFPGQSGSTTGDAGVPRIQVQDGFRNGDVDFLVSGSVVKTDPVGDPYTWQTVGAVGAAAYGSGWAASTTFGGSTSWEPLRYRLLPTDEVWMLGAFKTTAAAATAVLNLTGVYRPKKLSPLPAESVVTATGVRSNIMMGMGGSGNLNVLTSTGGSTATGQEFLINAQFPLDNVS